MYYVYLLECADHSIYTGITNDLEKRFKSHAEGKGARYTKAKKAVRIRYFEEHPSRSAASKREAEIKNWARQRKLDLIASQDNTRRIG